jgi:hypothetical protein
MIGITHYYTEEDNCVILRKFTVSSLNICFHTNKCLIPFELTCIGAGIETLYRFHQGDT